MARPENPINPADGPAALFASELRKLRRAAGSPTYREMAARANCSPPSLSTAANGRKVPSWEMTAAFLRGCNIRSLVELDQWRNRWITARSGTSGENSPTTSPPAALDLNRGLHETGRLPAVPSPRWPHLDVERFATWDRLVDGLDHVRVTLGLSYRDIMHRSRVANLPKIGGHQSAGLTISTISDVLTKKRRLSLGFLYAYLDACGATSTEILRWAETWRQIGIEERRLRRAMDAMRKPDEKRSITDQHLDMVEQLQRALIAEHARHPTTDQTVPVPPTTRSRLAAATVGTSAPARSRPAGRRRPRPPAHRDPNDTVKLKVGTIVIELPADRLLIVLCSIVIALALLLVLANIEAML